MIQATMMDYPLTLTHVLERAGRYFGQKEIVSRMPDRSLHRYTYQEMTGRAWQLAEALQKAGLQRGERVATLMWNHYAHFEAYFGIPVAGGVLHTLNLRLAPDDIAYIVNRSDDRFLIVDDVLLPLYEKFRKQVSFERVFVVPLTGEFTFIHDEHYEDYETFLETADGHFMFPQINEGDPAGMCYTSGTTGRPKGVVYSHRSTVLHTLGVMLPDSMNLSHRDTVMPVTPMFHANAWGLPYGGAMAGAKFVFPGPYLDALSLLDLCQKEHVTMASGVPTVWLALTQAMEQDKGRFDIRGLRMAVGGSSPPEALIRTLESYGCVVIHAWGMTETSPAASTTLVKDELSHEEQMKLKTKQGIPIPLVEMRIVRDKKEVPWDGQTMGEIQVRGPWITGTYHSEFDTHDSFTEDGWLRTGDIGTIDEAGNMQITDRTKDLIKSGGEWISSVALENAIMAHPAVAEAAVIAIPHPRWQERPLAAVVVKPDRQVTADELRELLEQQFPKWYLPDVIQFVESIPQTSTGKFMKAALRAQFGGVFQNGSDS